MPVYLNIVLLTLYIYNWMDWHAEYKNEIVVRQETFNTIDALLADMVESGILTEADAKARGDVAKAELKQIWKRLSNG